MRWPETVRLMSVSIHAPARGATVVVAISCHACDQFQSTLPRGERPQAHDVCLGVRIVSIHAPARGATHRLQLERRHVQCVSIHAPARGATSTSTVIADAAICFNPRSRAGSDRHELPRSCRSRCVSIHAPARGATVKVQLKKMKGKTVRFLRRRPFLSPQNYLLSKNSSYKALFNKPFLPFANLQLNPCEPIVRRTQSYEQRTFLI